MTNRRNLIIAAAVLLIVAFFLFSRLGRSNAAQFQTATVTRGPITQTVTATGTLNPVVNVQVGSQVSGNIQKLFADFNSKVKAGDIVAQIDPVIFTIANELTKMQIDANVAEADVGVVTVDQNVDFSVDAFPNRTFHGKVVQVRNAPITVQNVVTYDTVIGVNNADLKLKPGMTANVSIIIAHKDTVVQLKNAALRYRPPDAATAEQPKSTSSPSGQRPTGARERRAERTVYVLAYGRPNPVQIKTGISDGIMTEVIEGLKEGDRVVTAELTSPAGSSSPPANPFSGQQRRFP